MSRTPVRIKQKSTRTPVQIKFGPGVYVELVRQVRGLHCAEPGMLGKISRVAEDGGFVLVLACGHLVTVPREWFKRSSEAVWNAWKELEIEAFLKGPG